MDDMGATLALLLAPFVVSNIRLQALAKTVGTGDLWEARILGVPAAANPYDPKVIDVRLDVNGPDGHRLIPAFYYGPQTRALRAGKEVISEEGPGEWRVRFTPSQKGRYTLKVVAKVGALPQQSEPSQLSVAQKKFAGFVQRNPKAPRYLKLTSGAPFVPIGINMCWPGDAGTFQYDKWLPPASASGMNFIRIWCSPWYFGFEDAKGELGNYRQDRLWALDYFMEQCRKRGIRVGLCIDYHGVLNTVKDYWGANDNWRPNPYNAVNGGPCKTPNDFFTSPEARTLYRNRLRYLIARYSSDAALADWELWNEIDNVLGSLQVKDVEAWHQEMSSYLKANDPYKHLVTTSVTGRYWPDLWRIPTLDFTQTHAYGATAPGPSFAGSAAKMYEQFKKPMLVGEYGADWQGYNKPKDPHFRGLEQALWGSTLGGCMGSAQSWWWENFPADNPYPLYLKLSTFTREAGLGSAGWEPKAIQATFAGIDATVLGPIDPAGQKFTARIIPEDGWGSFVPGDVAVGSPRNLEQLGLRVNRFVHGKTHADMKRPLQLKAHFGEGGTVVLHVNSVSQGAVLVAKVDGKVALRKDLPDLDGKWEQNHEYDLDVVVPIGSGTHTIDVTNEGQDWAYLDWIEVRGALPALERPSRVPMPVVGSGTDKAFVAWGVDPNYNWPSRSTVAEVTPRKGVKIRVPGLLDGQYAITFVDPAGKKPDRLTHAQVRNGNVELDIPEFLADFAVRGIRLGP